MKSITFLYSISTFHNFALKVEPGWATRWFKSILETRNINNVFMYVCMVYFSWHKLLVWSLKNQWFLNFYCDLLIRVLKPSFHDPGGTSQITCILFGKQFVISSWNKLIILHGDIKSVLLNIFFAQNLTTSDNANSIQLWWIWTSTFWLGVENLKSSRQYDRT